MFNAMFIDIKKNIFHSKFKLFILFITQIIAVLCVFTTYGVASHLFYEKAKQTLDTTTFNVDFCLEKADGKPPIGKINYSEFNSKIQEILQLCNNNWRSMWCFGEVCYKGKTYFFTALKPNFYYDYNIIAGGFSQQDYLSNNPTITLKNNLLSFKSGDIITIGTQNYTIASTDGTGFLTDIILPYDFLNEEFEIRGFDIYMESLPTYNEVNSVSGKIVECFSSNITAAFPQVPDLIENQFNNSTVLITILVGIIVLVNFGYLYNYIMFTQSDVIFLYKIVGCRKNWIVEIFLMEFSIVSIVILPFSLALFFKVLCPFLTKYYDVFTTIYTTRVTILLIVGYYVLDVLVKYIKITQYIEKSYLTGKEVVLQ